MFSLSLVSLLSFLSYVHKYYYFYKLYIVCIRYYKSLIYIDMMVTGAKLDGLTRSLAHPTWRTSEAVSNQGSVRAVAVWVGLLKWDYYFVMISGTIEQKETLKILANTVAKSVSKMARDGLRSILGWTNFVCARGLDRLTRLGMDWRCNFVCRCVPIQFSFIYHNTCELFSLQPAHQNSRFAILLCLLLN